MASQYVVPQFIDVEDKILGPLTVRQFVILLSLSAVLWVMYKLEDLTLFLLTGIPVFGLGVTLAFVRINGQPFHFYLLNLSQFIRNPKLMVWDKTLTDGDLQDLLRETPPPAATPRIRKAPLELSHLSEVSLILNTGGVYRPEDHE